MVMAHKIKGQCSKSKQLAKTSHHKKTRQKIMRARAKTMQRLGTTIVNFHVISRKK
jgi:hypothetical protein